MVEEDKPKNIQPPSEAEIEELLTRIRPRPSSRFYRLMEKAPWEGKRFSLKVQQIRPLAATAGGTRLDHPTPRHQLFNHWKSQG